MTDLPFGFSSSKDPDDHRKGSSGGGSGPDGPTGPGGPGMPGMPGMPGGAGPFDFGQLGQMLSQLGEMISQAGSSSGPVNYDIAKKIALQRLADSSSATSEQQKAVDDAVRLAELWLDPVTTLPAGAGTAKAWSAKDWVEHTIPTWQRLCDPVAQRISGAWV